MLHIFDKLLSKLPLDGWKTQIGILLLGLPAALPEIVGAAQGVVVAVGGVVTAVGLLHKSIKELRK